MEEVPDQNIMRCAKKGIVVMELYSRIMQDLIKDKVKNVHLIRDRVEKNQLPNKTYHDGKLEKNQLRLIMHTGILNWDVSLCWAAKRAAKIVFNNDEMHYACEIIKERNETWHGIHFSLTEEQERHFYKNATEIATFFQICLQPGIPYLIELSNIRRRVLKGSQTAEIHQRVKSMEVMAEVPQSTEEIKLFVGSRFEEDLANSGNVAHLVLKLPISNDEVIDQCKSWFKTHGKHCNIGSHAFEVVAVEPGCIAVYITVSTTENIFIPEKIYDAVICYARKAFDFSGIDSKTTIEIAMFFDDTKMI